MLWWSQNSISAFESLFKVGHEVLCVYVSMFLVGGEPAGMHACMRACVCVAIFLFCIYVVSAFVYFCRRLRWVLPQSKLLSGSLVLLIVCVCACFCVQLCACLRSLACVDENRVAMLHLKGAVINEMNKRP